MPVPAQLQDPAVGRAASPSRGGVGLLAWLLVLTAATGGAAGGGVVPRAPREASQPDTRAATFIRNLANPRERRETRSDILDTPTLPGSVIKAATLVTALEAGLIRPDTGAMCRREVTVDGVRFVCAHPDLRRPLSPAEALAHSCNDFFVSLTRRLSRAQVNDTRLAAGLPPIGSATPLAPALVGLDGPKVTPRALIDVLARLAGVGPDAPVRMSASTRQVLRDGLTGAVTYGTAAALGERGISAMAKTGTAPMPGGGVAGLVVALTPAVNPTHGLVVVAPGGAGVDASALAADLVRPPSGSAPVVPAAATRGAAPIVPPGQSGPTAPPIRLGRTLPDGRVRVESIALDDYIAQVLAGEGQPGAAAPAQQALAIAARTFAVANRQRHRREGFDLCDTTHCQVVRAATPLTRQAAVATAGRVLLDGARAASIFYSASCGGRLERASQVWPGADDHDHPAADPADANEPPWTSEIRVADIERALAAAGLRGGRLRDLRIVQRNPSGRVARLRADGFVPNEVSGTDFRMAMGRVGGWQLIKSTAFELERTGGGYRFRGRGFGHGVGLCVVGAGARAAQGQSADEILRFYFPSLRVGPAPGAEVRTTTIPASAESAAPPSPAARPAAPAPARAATDVRLALPGAEEGERDTLLALVRRARDAVARATGQPVPVSLQVTVHPTVESFGRATGQPWWVGGATAGTAIDLLSVGVLRQRGALDTTVRHEVAHALVDEALRTRPMWVREGAAIYFSRDPAQAGEGSRGRVSCPTDAELLRPISAGAQREAYDRAAVCFARAMAAGTDWRQIR